MAKLWIIDGYNVIRRDPRLREAEASQGTPAARTILESQLTHFHGKRARGESLVLVYDGAPGATRPRKGFRIVHPERGRTADDVVLAEARRADGRQEACVVTSDIHDIAARLRGLRVTHMSVAEFSDLLWPAEDDGTAIEKPEAVSSSDVEFWMDAFANGDGEDGLSR